MFLKKLKLVFGTSESFVVLAGRSNISVCKRQLKFGNVGANGSRQQLRRCDNVAAV